MDAARGEFDMAPVVVADPLNGPWLVGPVRLLGTIGGAAPASVPVGTAVGVALTWESVPNDEASGPSGDGV